MPEEFDRKRKENEKSRAHEIYLDGLRSFYVADSFNFFYIS